MVVVQLAQVAPRSVVDVGAAPGPGLEPAHVPAVPVIDLTVLDEAPVGTVPAEERRGPARLDAHRRPPTTDRISGSKSSSKG